MGGGAGAQRPQAQPTPPRTARCPGHCKACKKMGITGSRLDMTPHARPPTPSLRLPCPCLKPGDVSRWQPRAGWSTASHPPCVLGRSLLHGRLGWTPSLSLLVLAVPRGCRVSSDPDSSLMSPVVPCVPGHTALGRVRLSHSPPPEISHRLTWESLRALLPALIHLVSGTERQALQPVRALDVKLLGLPKDVHARTILRPGRTAPSKVGR